MDKLFQVIRLEVWAFLGVLAAIVMYRLLTGAINVRGMLRSKNPRGKAVYSPERVQLLVITIAAALYLIGAVISSGKEFPTLPNEFAFALLGSHGIYLGGKAVRGRRSERGG